MANREPEPLWTAAKREETRLRLSCYVGDVPITLGTGQLSRADRTVAALIEALEASTLMLRQSDGIAEDGQALRNTALIDRLR